MLNIISSDDRYFSDMGNMRSYFLFSFANYYDPNNQSFGKIRVFNDDFLSGGSGFDFHPHKYYEILTLMLSGTITHKDSLGNHEKITKNQIQVTNTSTGIMHSEINEENQDLSLYQIWFAPENMNLKPIYYTATFNEEDFKNKLFPLASGLENNKNKLSSKITINRGVFDSGKDIFINIKSTNLFLYVTYGKIKINGNLILDKKFQLRVNEEKELSLEFLEKTDFILIESE